MKSLSTALLILLTTTLTSRAEDPPTTASGFLQRGQSRFRENRITESIEDFNQLVQLDPTAAPHLWQRGISHYYAGNYVEGRQQFESHKAVNQYDVENATWHFICVARLEGIKAARQALIKIDTSRDTRVPMTEVYQFYAAQGTSEAILKAAQNTNTEQAQMYAHLYLALYYEVAGDEKKARLHMQQAAAAKLHDNYMHDVAKVHLLQRK